MRRLTIMRLILATLLLASLSRAGYADDAKQTASPPDATAPRPKVAAVPDPSSLPAPAATAPTAAGPQRINYQSLDDNLNAMLKALEHFNSRILPKASKQDPDAVKLALRDAIPTKQRIAREVRTLVAQARAMDNRKQGREALRLLDQAIRLDKAHKEAMLLRTRIAMYFPEHWLGEASRRIGKIDNFVQRSQAHAAMAEVQARLGNTSDASVSARLALVQDDRDKAFAAVAISQAAEGDLPAAKVTANGIRDPYQVWTAYAGMAEALATRGQLGEALRLARIIDDRERHGLAMTRVIESLVALDRVDEAKPLLGQIAHTQWRSRASAALLKQGGDHTLQTASFPSSVDADAWLNAATGLTIDAAAKQLERTRDFRQRIALLAHQATLFKMKGDEDGYSKAVIQAKRLGRGMLAEADRTFANEMIALAQARAGDIDGAAMTVRWIADVNSRARAYRGIGRATARAARVDDAATMLAKLDGPEALHAALGLADGSR